MSRKRIIPPEKGEMPNVQVQSSEHLKSQPTSEGWFIKVLPPYFLLKLVETLPSKQLNPSPFRPPVPASYEWRLQSSCICPCRYRIRQWLYVVGAFPWWRGTNSLPFHKSENTRNYSLKKQQNVVIWAAGFQKLKTFTQCRGLIIFKKRTQLNHN